MVKMGKDEDSVEKIQILFIKIRLFLGSSELPLTLLQQYVRQRYKTVTSKEESCVFLTKMSGRRDALCDQIYVQDKEQ